MIATAEGIPRQNTDEWHRARAGKITASRFPDIRRSRNGTGWSDGATTYAYELVGERLRLDSPDWKAPKDPDIYALNYGRDMEPIARADYIFKTTHQIAEYGFIEHLRVENIGASLDGVVVNENGFIEIKCPLTTKEHVRTLHTKQVPKKYLDQVYGGLWVSGREWCDFISFDNRIADHLTTAIVRVNHDKEVIGELAKRITEFKDFVDAIEREVRSDRAA